MNKYKLITQKKEVIGEVSAREDYSEFIINLSQEFKTEYGKLLSEVLSDLQESKDQEVIIDREKISNSSRGFWEAFVQNTFRFLNILIVIDK